MFRLRGALLQLHRDNGTSVLSEKEQSESLLISYFRRNRQKNRKPSLFRAMTGSRLQSYVVAGGILVAAIVILGPWVLNEYREILGLHYTPLDPRHQPALSCAWWESEWRKMNPTWRRGESDAGFYESSLGFLESVTGREVHTAAGMERTRPAPSRSSPEPPSALVPLCGDTPMLGVLALKGYLVDGVDASSTGIRAAVERTERMLPPAYYNRRVRLHWSDIFSPELWQGHSGEPPPLQRLEGSKHSGPPMYDLIYERQGFTSIPKSQRPDYAHLLSQALKPDGIMYVEGIFRTGRVANNKHAGPPFGLSRKELKELFPDNHPNKFHVVCEEKFDALIKLSREDRVLQRVPKELYVTPFHCAVFRDAAVNVERLAALRAEKAKETREEPAAKEMLHF